MAQPPAVVARTYRPMGQSQLCHLGEPASFHYARCRQNKTANHVKTTDGNRTQTFRECYLGSMVYSHRKRRKNAAAEKEAPCTGDAAAVKEDRAQAPERKAATADGEDSASAAKEGKR